MLQKSVITYVAQVRFIIPPKCDMKEQQKQLRNNRKNANAHHTKGRTHATWNKQKQEQPYNKQQEIEQGTAYPVNRTTPPPVSSSNNTADSETSLVNWNKLSNRSKNQETKQGKLINRASHMQKQSTLQLRSADNH